MAKHPIDELLQKLSDGDTLAVSATTTAENHWWGSPSGPSHAQNPGGSGDKVTDKVDYKPWAAQPCTH